MDIQNIVIYPWPQIAYVKPEHFNQSKLVLSINKGNSKGKFEKHELAIFFSLAVSRPYQTQRIFFFF